MYEVTVGIGGIKMTTESKEKNISANASKMMRVVKSVQYKNNIRRMEMKKLTSMEEFETLKDSGKTVLCFRLIGVLIAALSIRFTRNRG